MCYKCIKVDKTNIKQAATIHSISWQESHRSFCSEDFVNLHTPERQRGYLKKKMDAGSEIYMLMDGEPVAIVSITGDLIEDLYVIPDKQNNGYGTMLLEFAIGRCKSNPRLWILENNKGAERLYRKMGFVETGRVNSVDKGLDEIEFFIPLTIR